MYHQNRYLLIARLLDSKHSVEKLGTRGFFSGNAKKTAQSTACDARINELAAHLHIWLNFEAGVRCTRNTFLVRLDDKVRHTHLF
jgi:hypothetical protein